MNDESADFAAARTAALTAPASDRIFLHDHVAEIEIGAFREEYGVTQRLRFNVDLDVRRFHLSYDDEVESVVSYDLILEAIEALAAGPRMKLVETFAERLAERLLTEPRVTSALIRIEKLDRVSGSLGVEIERRSP